MKNLFLFLFLTACSFQAETNNLNINYLNINDLTVEKLHFSIDEKIKK
tara:strand:- start:425 stop:568 length:144 start_codon:yes stop_codon:yes gene_type:complete